MTVIGKRYLAVFAATTVLALGLYGCGGGGGGPGPVTDSRGSTTPVVVDIPGLDVPPISSIHLEASDPYAHINTPIRDLGLDNVIIHNYGRQQMVCPGVPPHGNECKVYSTEIDGSTYQYSSPFDFSIGEQVRFLTAHDGFTNLSSEHGFQKVYGLKFISGSGLFETFGAWGKYSAFYSSSVLMAPDIHAEIIGIRTTSAAFGSLYEGKPNAGQGGATWKGIMFGHTREEGVDLVGKSILEYDFSDDTLDLELSDIAPGIPSYRYGGSDKFIWRNLKQNSDGSFFIRGHGNDRRGTPLHPSLGYVDGDFYGPNAEEFAGVFERQGVVGAFGGSREELRQ